MISVLNEIIEGDIKIIEYTKDGVTVSHTVRQPIVNESEIPTEPIETLEQKFERLEQKLQNDSVIQLEVLATIFEELIMMKE